MEIQKIHLVNFRNYVDQSMSFSNGVNILTGPNGQGKTNILEAISIISQGHSFRTNSKAEFINWNAKDCVLRMESKLNGKNHVHSLALSKNGKRTIKVNGVESSRMADLFGNFPLIIMEPGDVNLVKGAPQSRRRFIDILICQHNPKYMDYLSKYKRVLNQKNSLLKLEQFDFNVMAILNAQIAKLGAEIIVSRQTNLKDLNFKSQKLYSVISNHQENLNILYTNKAALESSNSAEIELILTQKILRASEAEKIRKSALVGPHRDDFILQIKDHSLKDFGSQGQCRSAALALKLASTELLEQETGRKPILLLDDIFAELDDNRKKALQKLALNSSQAFVTAPHLEGLNFKEFKHFSINENEIICTE